ncbi:MAG TPA: hypothetical protein VN643_01885 [Pyrinomonadaceae bacterium]|nr:hypothetical protein [Pyrinomonadaceae bacterium]
MSQKLYPQITQIAQMFLFGEHRKVYGNVMQSMDADFLIITVA